MSNMFSVKAELFYYMFGTAYLHNRHMLCYVKDSDIKAITVLPDVVGDEEELEEGWDAID
jgi:hypothetical protein